MLESDLEKKIKNKAWGIMNSPFFLFFVSSIVVSLSVWSYNFYSNNKKQTREAIDQLQRLATEIKNRFYKIKNVEFECSDEDLKEIGACYRGVNSEKVSDEFNSFEEYKNRNIYSLYTQMYKTAVDLKNLDEQRHFAIDILRDPQKINREDEGEEMWMADTAFNNRITALKQTEKYFSILEKTKPHVKSARNADNVIFYRKLGSADSASVSNFLKDFGSLWFMNFQ